MTHLRSAHRVNRIAFVLYALALVTATHWPKLVIQVPHISFADKIVHFSAFLLWTILFGLTGWFRHRRSPGMQLLVIGLIAGFYAVIDELTQGIPAVSRMVSMSDLAANLLGIAFGVWMLTIIGRKRDRPVT